MPKHINCKHVHRSNWSALMKENDVNHRQGNKEKLPIKRGASFRLQRQQEHMRTMQKMRGCLIQVRHHCLLRNSQYHLLEHVGILDTSKCSLLPACCLLLCQAWLPLWLPSKTLNSSCLHNPPLWCCRLLLPRSCQVSPLKFDGEQC